MMLELGYTLVKKIVQTHLSFSMVVRGIKHVSLSSPPLLTRGRLTVFQGFSCSAWQCLGCMLFHRCGEYVCCCRKKKSRGVLGITELTEAEESLNGVWLLCGFGKIFESVLGRSVDLRRFGVKGREIAVCLFVFCFGFVLLLGCCFFVFVLLSLWFGLGLVFGFFFCSSCV